MNKILVVEDEKLIRQGLVSMIKRADIEIQSILEAKNGEEALEILKSQEIDLVFTDIRMPKMDGIEFVKNVCNEYSDPPVIVVVSGFDDFSYAVEMLRNGVRDYLLKPVERAKMFSLLAQIDDEISRKKVNKKGNEQAFIQVIKFFMHEDNPEDDTAASLVSQYKEQFITSEYICICGKFTLKNNYPELITINDTNNIMVYFLPVLYKEKIIGEAVGAVGFSNVHNGLETINESFFTSFKCI